MRDERGRFLQGCTPGPGRPRKYIKGVITDAALQFLESEHPDHPGKTRAQVIAEEWVTRAETGQDLGELLTRVEGKPTEKLEINDSREPTVVELPFKDADDTTTAGTTDAIPEK